MKLKVPSLLLIDSVQRKEERYLTHCEAIALIIANHKHDNPALAPMSTIDVAIEKYLKVTGAKIQ